MDRYIPYACCGPSGAERVILPLPPQRLCDETRFDMEVYARFMRHLRAVPNSRTEIKILSAIRFTADMMETGEEMVAKVLTDLGLRAPREAFPAAFLAFADRAARREAWDCGTPPPGLVRLLAHWDMTDESWRFMTACAAECAAASCVLA